MKKLIIALFILFNLVAVNLYARDILYEGSEVQVFVTPGEPTQIDFDAEVQSGFKGSGAGFKVEPNGKSIIIFPQEELSASGGVIIVKLKNDKTYTMRVKSADTYNPRDDIVTLKDDTPAFLPAEDGIRDCLLSRGLGDVYKRQHQE